MSDQLSKPFIPAQYAGEETETFHTIAGTDGQQAKEMFAAARARLLDVNRWGDICGRLSSDFQLADNAGNLVNGEAQIGLYIRIDIPGPGSATGSGYDWVWIEKTEDIKLNENQELFFMRVRPAENPAQKHEGIAHFLQQEATSSFVVTRDYNKIIATVYGRNEVPNSATGPLTDRLRNTIVGSGGALGFSKLQWGALVKAVLA